MLIDLEHWRAVAAPFYEVHPKRPAAEAGVDVDATSAGGLLLSRIATPEQMLVHDPRTRRHVSHDYLLFERFHRGGGRGEVAGTGFAVAPSRLHLIDMSRRYVSLKGASQSEGVLIPHQMLGFDPGRDPPFATVDLASAPGRLLASAHRLLVASAADADEAGARALAPPVIKLVQRVMLRRDGETARDRAEASLDRILRDFIHANLADASVTPSVLREAFGLSRTTLYRHFEDEGGVARYIRNRRLDRCFFELAGAARTQGAVGAVARRWGFTDATHFTRLFKERFGIAPSECLAEPLVPVAPSSSRLMSTVETWLRHL